MTDSIYASCDFCTNCIGRYRFSLFGDQHPSGAVISLLTGKAISDGGSESDSGVEVAGSLAPPQSCLRSGSGGWQPTRGAMNTDANDGDDDSTTPLLPYSEGEEGEEGEQGEEGEEAEEADDADIEQHAFDVIAHVICTWDMPSAPNWTRPPNPDEPAYSLLLAAHHTRERG
ncbi:hypothetical protein T492DRAFT_1127225 [Pavlovales sp. CCMP2436]|nr:hypothetical protein T492DRAFT_1127225 [Pavlovales sp. CCMP2436]